ncbi:MAG: hypothetical protein MZW92_59305 [Comamonadaceae bacterium]|nr:hypothetical protein [Comamonadaceae bacterium]
MRSAWLAARRARALALALGAGGAAGRRGAAGDGVDPRPLARRCADPGRRRADAGRHARWRSRCSCRTASCAAATSSSTSSPSAPRPRARALAGCAPAHALLGAGDARCWPGAPASARWLDMRRRRDHDDARRCRRGSPTLAMVPGLALSALVAARARGAALRGAAADMRRPALMDAGARRDRRCCMFAAHAGADGAARADLASRCSCPARRATVADRRRPALAQPT